MRTITFSAMAGAGIGVLVGSAFAGCYPGQELGILWATACAVAGANLGAMMGALIRTVRSEER
jgi:hypothetical protein